MEGTADDSKLSQQLLILPAYTLDSFLTYNITYGFIMYNQNVLLEHAWSRIMKKQLKESNRDRGQWIMGLHTKQYIYVHVFALRWHNWLSSINGKANIPQKDGKANMNVELLYFN